MEVNLTAQVEQLARDLATKAGTLDELNALLRSLMKSALQSMLDTEMDVHLGRKQYPNGDSAVKLIYLAILEASKKWTMPIQGWKQALNHFAILFEGRLPANSRN